MKYDKDNINLKKKFEIIKKLRSKNLPTIPTSLEDELNSNIFLRCDQNDLKIKLNMKNQEDFKVFRKVRDLKDSFLINCYNLTCQVRKLYCPYFQI